MCPQSTWKMFLFLFEGAAPLLQRSFKIHVFLSKIIYDGARRTIVIALASFIGFKDWICLHVLYNESLRFKNIRIPFKSFFFDQKKKFILFNWIYFSRSLFFSDNEKIGKEKFAQPRLQFKLLIWIFNLLSCAQLLRQMIRPTKWVASQNQEVYTRTLKKRNLTGLFPSSKVGLLLYVQLW